MPRIRTIKPEFWTSEQVVDCSTTARLLFVGLWNFCDDAGRHRASCKRLKMEVFPADQFTQSEIQEWIDELVEVGLLLAYVVDGKEFWQVTGWHHQKIEKKTVRYPDPSKGEPISTTARRPVDDQSTTARPRKGREGKGRERKGRDTLTASAVCADLRQNGSSAPSEYTFPTNGKGGKSWTLPQPKLDEYLSAYPALDVAGEMVKARQWCRDNPTRRKTVGGMLSFLTAWLNRAQNRGRLRAPSEGDGAADMINPADYQ